MFASTIQMNSTEEMQQAIIWKGMKLRWKKMTPRDFLKTYLRDDFLSRFITVPRYTPLGELFARYFMARRFPRLNFWQNLSLRRPSPRKLSVSSVLDSELFAVNFRSNHSIYFWGIYSKTCCKAKYTNKGNYRWKRTILFLSATRHMCAKFLRQIRPLIIRIIYVIILIM